MHTRNITSQQLEELQAVYDCQSKALELDCCVVSGVFIVELTAVNTLAQIYENSVTELSNEFKSQVVAGKV